MSTVDEHIREAERLQAKANEIAERPLVLGMNVAERMQSIQILLMGAQVHATLAVAKGQGEAR